MPAASELLALRIAIIALGQDAAQPSAPDVSPRVRNHVGESLPYTAAHAPEQRFGTPHQRVSGDYAFFGPWLLRSTETRLRGNNRRVLWPIPSSSGSGALR